MRKPYLSDLTEWQWAIIESPIPSCPVGRPREVEMREVRLEEGDFLVVPRGVEHRPVAEQKVHVLLFVPAGTLNTGDVRDERTVREPERI